MRHIPSYPHGIITASPGKEVRREEELDPASTGHEPESISRQEQQCEAALEDLRWPEGFRCPKCSSSQHYRCRRNGLRIFQCCGCRIRTSLTEDTIFHSTKLPLTIWFQSMFFLTQNKNNVSTLELRRHLGISYPAEAQAHAGHV